jgi:hypothetical protein
VTDTKTEHTPGPWEGLVIDDADSRQIIITAQAHQFDLDEARANARLIAAAPNLLAACRDLDNLLEADCASGGDYHDTRLGRFSPRDCPACRNRAAIAKAEGPEVIL